MDRFSGLFALAVIASSLPARAEEQGQRYVHADIAALDQMVVYNRFGSFNPFGMMFALTRDLSPADAKPDFASVAEQTENCSERTGAEPGLSSTGLTAGNVRLKDCKRPRPMVLRANVGDILHVRLHNYLWGDPLPAARAPDLSESFCKSVGRLDSNTTTIRALVSEGVNDGVAQKMGLALCDTGSKGMKAETKAEDDQQLSLDSGADWPMTRGVNLVFQGLTPVSASGDEGGAGLNPACLGHGLIAPGAGPIDCFWRADQEGTYFGASTAAPAGGQGGGGSLSHGLFAAVVVEPKGSQWFRSQVTETAFNKVWEKPAGNIPHVRGTKLDYQVMDGDTPVLNMARDLEPVIDLGSGSWVATKQPFSGTARHIELVHTDLNAIIDAPNGPFREFSVFFHDELKSFYTRNFDELAMFGQLAGVRDGFAINYGASGMGGALLANRKGIGPAADCVECLYEEFFLSSWANGDPALLEGFPDDPSNVHHSYLNDAVVYRNFHAGPKETHVFHLHAHQWFGGNDQGRGSYLDSQTVAPQQGFSYRIYGGGLPDPATLPAGATAGQKGWWEAMGSGNRNRTPGDSIFHCHLYPHFAQGMWALWRVHDVLEDGSRRLPDGQVEPGFSTEIRTTDERKASRSGSVGADGSFVPDAPGTPIPGLVPLPSQALPIIPTYKDQTYATETATADTAFPGYPFYIGAKAGHRPPQAPLDVVYDGDKPTGGIGRHIITGGTREGAIQVTTADLDPTNRPRLELMMTQLIAKALALGDMTAHFETLTLTELPLDGTALEKAAMSVHFDGAGATTVDPLGNPVDAAVGSYPVPKAPPPGGEDLDNSGGRFAVNGAPPKPGAPFADPCAAHPSLLGLELPVSVPNLPPFKLAPIADKLAGEKIFLPDPYLTGFRRYKGSAVQVGLVTNTAGWHDPQGRINVLTADSDAYKQGGGQISPLVSGEEQPFFFRAFSGECIEFHHTNELPKELELDDFQVRTPTDTIGQHIHLVKFDVMASDGSGNGFNYEDGTFAADELIARRCSVAGNENLPICAMKDVWKLKRSDDPILFQTTVQRWFADPILSATSEAKAPSDRTMKTIFTHDHFGPSSIQQHGFYGALVIEPSSANICSADASKPGACMPPPSRTSVAELTSVEDDPFRLGVGPRALIKDLSDPLPPGMGAGHIPNDPSLANYREFALAVADFATLYDPRDRDSIADACAGVSTGKVTEPSPEECKGQTGGRIDASPKGMAKLACEAWFMASPALLASYCGAGFEGPGPNGWYAKDSVPAWIAFGFNRLANAQAALGATPHSGLISYTEAADLFDHMIRYRRAAAGNSSDTGDLAKPIAPPDRPESISVDHHDPYLVNYRGEPAPLRLGSGGSGQDCNPKTLAEWAMLLVGQGDKIGRCSIDRQRDGDPGDPALLFASQPHGADAVTPLIESYTGEKIMIRLIQGAQEVQHAFTIEGRQWSRNTDQAYASASDLPDRSTTLSADPTLREACLRADAARNTNPVFHEAWRVVGPPPNLATTDPAFVEYLDRLKSFIGTLAQGDPVFIRFSSWAADYEKLVAGCVNLEGMVTAQEIGISEHFEFTSAFRHNAPGSERATDGFVIDGESANDGVVIGESSAGAGDGGVSLIDYGDANDSRDTVYHFGSVDALWNGAWGLLRVYKDGTVDDITCSPSDDLLAHPDCLKPTSGPVGQRLASLADSGPAPGGFGTGPINFSGDLPCGPGAETLRAMVVAVSTRTAFGGALPYGGSLSDPDGLFLSLVEPVEHGELFRRNVTVQERADMLASIRATHGVRGEHLQPLVLPVTAGTCLDLTVVNLLESAGLPDGIGDAPLPPITPLNVGIAHAPKEAATITMQLAAEKGSAAMTGLRPSNQLVLKLGLPILNATNKINEPFGQNGVLPLKPGQMERTVYYAGRLVQADAGKIFAGVAKERARQFGVGPWTEEDEARVTADVIATASRWMPYAWGPLPLRTMGDVFGHGPHGMIGTVLVLPKTYEWVEGGPTVVDGALLPARDLDDSSFGNARLYTLDLTGLPVEGMAAEPEPRALRSFVLHWRDGMALRDDRSALIWRDKRGRLLPGLKLVPDCKVCDDSYDLGAAGVDYLSPQFATLLRDQRSKWVEANFDLNAIAFPADFYSKSIASGAVPVLYAKAGEEIVIDIVHPGGRARQRAFVAFAQGYDDLFPGFGFPHAALLAPGKAVTASLMRRARPGCYLFSDGPAQLRANGVWGMIDVADKDGNPSCPS
jgi:hypothetical protein